MLKELNTVFVNNYDLATYRAGDGIFEYKNNNTQIFMRSAHDPKSLESATYKAVWLDEAGQYSREAWEAIQRRVYVKRGRTLITTTPYSQNWLKTELYDRWKAGDTDIEVIQCPSTDNPSFPRDAYEKARATKPAWYFNMMFKGEFDKPASMIYDCFDSETDVLKAPIDLPANWPRFQCVDFAGTGGTTAALWFAYSPADGDLYLYDEYEASGNAIAHVKEWKKRQADRKETLVKRVGGSPQEEAERGYYRELGWPISQPNIGSVEVGINRVYAFLNMHKIHVFPHCYGFISEIQSYCRVVDENGDTTEEIANKQDFHYMDSMRYGVAEYDASIKVESATEIEVLRWRR
jgi:hypothetical protein